jgi:Cof subfamily protein (haloacid dehalogenase superfamily)
MCRVSIKLLGLDVDGTLLKHDKTVHPDDLAAIRRARDAGITVVLATGRLVGTTMAIAEQVGLDGLMVCADGTLVVDAKTHHVVERRSFALSHARHATALAREHGLGTFVLHDDAIHFDERAAMHAHYASGWTPHLTQHTQLAECCVTDQVLGIISFGPERQVEQTRERLGDRAGAATLTFGALVDHVLKLTPAGVDKATGLAAVAERLGLKREQVAAVGDWLNDVPMLRWAGRSYAMGQAVEEVKRSAQRVLVATARDGGGIAEAVELILGE